MPDRSRNHISLALCCTVLFAICGTNVCHAAKTNAPNVVILLADDLGWGDVGFHGGIASTPHLDRLAKESLELTRFYAFPSCSAARAALLTGRFPQRYGIVGPVTPRNEGLPVSERIIPAAFQTAGYQTSLIGKWHLSHGTEEERHPTSRGFDYFYGFMGASVDYYKHTSSKGRDDWQRDGEAVSEDGYATDLLAADVINRITSRNKNQPFCILASFNAPHSPFQAPRELIKKYVREHGDRTGTYAAMVESLDSAIGRILKTLDKERLTNNTIVVFASDNGAARVGNNLPFRGVKREVLEGGIHVPCLVHYPGHIRPGKSDQLSAIYDLFPTLASACGVKLPDEKPLDGNDLWSTLLAGKTISRDVVIAEDDFALIKGDWKVINSDRGSTTLFNLQADIAEKNDLSSAESVMASQMMGVLARFQDDLKTDEVGLAALSRPADTAHSTKSNGTGDSPDIKEGQDLANFELEGDVEFSILGDQRVESSGLGLRLLSGVDKNGDQKHSGSAAKWVDDISADKGRWYRLQIRGSAQQHFKVKQDGLFLKVEFFKNQRRDALDSITTRIYPQVERERKDFTDEGTNQNIGPAIWRTYAMDFRTPFPQIDSFRLSVGFENGTGSGLRSEFKVASMELISIKEPEPFAARKLATTKVATAQPDEKELVPLGGRWFFEPRGQSRSLPTQFDHTNSDQLLYKTDRFERPFAQNMTSWLRNGYLDLAGDTVTIDRFLSDNLIIEVTRRHIVMRSKNIPNHPTASFPDKWRQLDGNPAYIKEQANVWHIPLVPKSNPAHIAMDRLNENKALPMGAVGVATNGVIFFNPFDHILETDATWRLDRCCGHPSPQNQYHYHKYPVCVKTPWIDDGSAHSPVIGFAFDGYPVYGPYESADTLAMDDKENPLNDFNLHEDKIRGPHYHVTPGKFPHIIGGYWGHLEQLNRPGRR